MFVEVSHGPAGVTWRRFASAAATALVISLAELACSGGTDPAPAAGDQAPSAPVPEPESPLRSPEIRGAIPRDARIADYTIDATLDAESHRVTGTVRLTWRNRTTRTLDDLQFHLYMNAFRADDTAWMQEARGGHRGQHLEHEDETAGWGYIDIQAIRRLSPARPSVNSPSSELQEREPVKLRWAEGEDPTVMAVTLDKPLGPAREITVELDFVTQLPRVFARTGYADDFHMLGQWFPKIAVLEDGAGWRNHVFTLNSEFYADFGNYAVSLDVPESAIVGATGVRTSERVEDGRKHLRYEAEMVHDFAWVADPDFVEHRSEWHGIRIRQLLQPERARDAARHLEAQIAALESMERRFGPYPWSTITIVHPPKSAKGAGGMEYPTLFTTSDILERKPYFALIGFEEHVSGVFTTIHEFGHQYFQGLLASNENQQPWLDEGLNSMSNTLAFIDWTGDPRPTLARVGNQELRADHMTRLSLLGASDLVPVDSPSEGHPKLLKTYGVTVYRKTMAFMLTLRNLVGADRFDRAMRTYADRWRFRHPRGEDLVATLVDVIGPARVPDRER